MKAKKNVIKLLSVVLILGGFFFITEIFKEKERASFTVDSEKFDVAKTEKELKEKLNRSLQHFNPEQLELIDKYKLMTEINNVEVDLIGEQRNFKIESLWNEDIGLLVTYSLDLSPFDEGPEEIPYLKVDRLTYHRDGKEPMELAVEERRNGLAPSISSDGVVFENRIYRRVVLYPNMNEQKFRDFASWLDNQRGVQYNPDAITNINKISLEEVKMIEKTETNEKSIAMEDLTIDYNFKPWNPVLETTSIDKTIKLDDNTTITYKNIEKRLNFSQINIDLESLHDFTELTYKNDNIQYTPINTDLDGQQFIRLHNYPGQRNSGDINLEVLGGTYQTDGELTFTITKDELEKFKKELKDGSDSYEINRELGEVNNIKFSLKGLENNDQWDPEFKYGFLLETKTDKDFDRLHFNDYTEYKRHLEENPEAAQYMTGDSFYELTNQDGKPVRSQNGYSRSSSAEDEEFALIQFFGIHDEEFEKLQELNIKLFQIPDQVKFEKNEITIKLND